MPWLSVATVARGSSVDLVAILTCVSCKLSYTFSVYTPVASSKIIIFSAAASISSAFSLACFFEASHKLSATKTAQKFNGYLSFFAVSYDSHLRLSRSHAYTCNSSGSNSLCKTIVRTRTKRIGSGFKPDP